MPGVLPTVGSAWDYPGRPLGLHEVTHIVDAVTGEIVAFEGLNTDPDRCPAESCGECGAKCTCAPCACEDCEGRTAWACQAAPLPVPARKLVLF